MRIKVKLIDLIKRISVFIDKGSYEIEGLLNLLEFHLKTELQPLREEEQREIFLELCKLINKVSSSRADQKRTVKNKLQAIKTKLSLYLIEFFPQEILIYEEICTKTGKLRRKPKEEFLRLFAKDVYLNRHLPVEELSNLE